MLTKEQTNIFAVFNIFDSLTFKQIKVLSKQKSNSITQNALKEFQKHNLIKIKKIGNINTYSLNLNNNLTLSYLNLINDLSIKNIPKEVLNKIKNNIFKHTKLFILIIFGSYANNKHTKNSDLDIAIITNEKKEIRPYIETIKRREIIKIDYHIFTEKEFLDMLSEDQENVGKEIYKKSIIYYGIINYYNLIKNGI